MENQRERSRPHDPLRRYTSANPRARLYENEQNKALLGTRHKWRVPRTLTFCFTDEMKMIEIGATTTARR
jgi:hypothetical protein